MSGVEQPIREVHPRRHVAARPQRRQKRRRAPRHPLAGVVILATDEHVRHAELRALPHHHRSRHPHRQVIAALARALQRLLVGFKQLRVDRAERSRDEVPERFANRHGALGARDRGVHLGALGDLPRRRQLDVRTMQAAAEVEPAPAARLGRRVEVVEERCEAEVVPLRDRVELVIVALGAADGQSEEDGSERVGPVDDVASEALLGQRRADVDDQVQPVKPRRDELVRARVLAQVARELIAQELVIWQVARERTDHPVPVRRQVAVVVVMDSVGVREPDSVEPVTRHVFAILRPRQQPLDEALVRARGFVGEELLDLVARRRQARQVERDPTDQGASVRRRLRRTPRAA